MSNSISIWKDKILLNWNGVMPHGYDQNDHVEIQDMPHLWPHLKGHCSYNNKMHKFVLSFSKQNLVRLRTQFGSIPVIHGFERVAELKTKYDEFLVMRELSESIQRGDYDDKVKIDYKLPPLATYQHRGVIYLSMVPKAPLFADCGVGKTYMVVMSTENQIKTGLLKRGKTLICGKLATLETGWADDTKKFTDLKTTILWTGSSYKRREKILAKLEEDADIYVINHEGVKGFEAELIAKKFDKVVVDECTILKSFTGLHSKMAGGTLGKSIVRVAEHARWKVIMSGTPAPNSAEDLWGQMNFLDPEGFLLEAGYKDFRTKHMHKIVFGRLKKDAQGNNIPGEPENRNTPTSWVLTEGEDKKINAMIAPHVFRVRIRDHIKDLPPKTVICRSIPMSSEQQKLYDKVQNDLWVFLNDGEVSTGNTLTELIKLRQVTGGFIIADDSKPRPMKTNPKLDMMDQLLNEEIDASKKVVVFAQYQWEIKTLEERYKKYGVVTVYGGNNGNKNLENLRTFMEEGSCRLIILHPRSAAHGVTLTMANYMIFYSISYSAEEDYQAVARIERASQKNPMFVYYLLAKAKKGFSIDEIIYKVLNSKQKKQDYLLDLKQGELDSDIMGMWKKQFKKG